MAVCDSRRWGSRHNENGPPSIHPMTVMMTTASSANGATTSNCHNHKHHRFAARTQCTIFTIFTTKLPNIYALIALTRSGYKPTDRPTHHRKPSQLCNTETESIVTTFTLVAGGLELVAFDVSRCCGPASVDMVASTLFAFASHLSGAFGWPSSDGAILDLLIDDIGRYKKNLH